ncbi:hypothetical protein QJU43_03040 [Pasteurella atlantica]|uniref:Uncharacterized protein n=2 Tax=Pasteurellaceae TaxID=712 RepID=A0ACC6HPD6_9PAST|nr:hypothetical protein [Pasteurella atlantica]MDP8033247.1 hypothetical protein [Pasteurella atlantica]MDP8035203.1 hypothetical protein [Pasteurella atlantica]MDP8037153.1 hypothetical protein [Pasteurella atlantica]MDP8047340.1 hypothetical protein [Pasteurella atlantica]MDP8049436.1 hypothetical protein [Pasteurella atlantica]
MKKLGLLTAMTILTACGSIGNVIISDQTLQEKAAFALNTTSNKVKISQRNAGLDDIRFVASVGRKSYQCYITTVAGVVSSDAICSGSRSVKQKRGSTCNALLKAAGRC